MTTDLTSRGEILMDSPERCPRTELIKTQCGHCRALRPPQFTEASFDSPGGARSPVADQGDERIVATFTARYGGHCAQCDGRIEPGDRISWTTQGNYLCPDCAP